jgi:FlaA1/EpsC-like NDP-sugar epimerase
MGESVKIRDLIYKIINLSGLTVKDSKNPNGDIEIKIIGLRPGEKLYEELLIGDNPQKTHHHKIIKTNEPFIPYAQLELDLINLKILLDKNKVKEVKELLEKLIKSFKSNSEIVDHLYIEGLLFNKYQENQSANNLESKNDNDKRNKVIKFSK